MKSNSLWQQQAKYILQVWYIRIISESENVYVTKQMEN
jgi:hypothetical protein